MYTNCDAETFQGPNQLAKAKIDVMIDALQGEGFQSSTHPVFVEKLRSVHNRPCWACNITLPKVVTGGFEGVDVFLLISGFLISIILFTEMTNHRFSFALWKVHPAHFPTLAVCFAAVSALAPSR